MLKPLVYLSKCLGNLGLILTILFGIGTPQAFAYRCHACNREQRLSQCSQCGVGQYCDSTCQKKDWKAHKKVCKEFKSLQRLEGRTEIKESTLPEAGLGLFATRDLAVGEEVAAYAGTLMTENVSLKACHQLSSFYLSTTLGGNNIDGFHENIPPHLGAALANDALASSEFVEAMYNVDYQHLEAEAPRLKSLVIQYLRNILLASLPSNDLGINVEQKHTYPSLFPIFVVSKKIKKGEEIFSLYELSYWSNIVFGIARRKSSLKEALRLRRIFSEAVESFVLEKRLPNDALKIFFPYYVNESQNAALEKELFADRATELSFRIVSLMGDFSAFRAFISSDSDLTQIETFLDELAGRPNSEFYRPNQGVVIHPQSVAWLKKMVLENQVAIIDAVKRRAIPWAELDPDALPDAAIDNSADTKREQKS